MAEEARGLIKGGVVDEARDGSQRIRHNAGNEYAAGSLAATGRA